MKLGCSLALLVEVSPTKVVAICLTDADEIKLSSIPFTRMSPRTECDGLEQGDLVRIEGRDDRVLVRHAASLMVRDSYAICERLLDAGEQYWRAQHASRETHRETQSASLALS